MSLLWSLTSDIKLENKGVTQKEFCGNHSFVLRLSSQNWKFSVSSRYFQIVISRLILTRSNKQLPTWNCSSNLKRWNTNFTPLFIITYFLIISQTSEGQPDNYILSILLIFLLSTHLDGLSRPPPWGCWQHIRIYSCSASWWNSHRPSSIRWGSSWASRLWRMGKAPPCQNE